MAADSHDVGRGEYDQQLAERLAELLVAEYQRRVAESPSQPTMSANTKVPASARITLAGDSAA